MQQNYGLPGENRTREGTCINLTDEGGMRGVSSLVNDFHVREGGGGHAAIGDASPLQQERLELLLSERVLLHMGPDHLACR